MASLLAGVRYEGCLQAPGSVPAKWPCKNSRICNIYNGVYFIALIKSFSDKLFTLVLLLPSMNLPLKAADQSLQQPHFLQQ